MTAAGQTSLFADGVCANASTSTTVTKKAVLLMQGIDLAGAFCRANNIPMPRVDVSPPDRWRVDACAYYRDGRIAICTAPAGKMAAIAGKMAAGSQVALEYTADQLVMRSGRARFALSTLPVDDFPIFSVDDWLADFSVPTGDLRSLIDRTTHAMSRESERYYLQGLYFHAVPIGAGVLRGVATDGHRLALADVALPDGAAGMPSVIVHRDTLGHLRKLIDKIEDAYVEVCVSDRKIRFAFGSIVFMSKLVDGQFPDYVRVIPDDCTKIVDVDRTALIRAIDRVAAITSEKTRVVKASFGRGQMSLEATDPTAGSAVEEMDAGYGGANCEVGVNARYVLDTLGVLSGERVQWAMADSASPMLLSDPDDPTTTHVLMPVRV